MEKKSSLVALIIAVIIVGGLIIFIIVSSGDPQINIDEDRIKIDCIYGTEIPLSDISSIELNEHSFDDIAPFWNKTNGFDGFNSSFRNAYRGNFRTVDLGQILVYVIADSSPTIVLYRIDKKPVYISLDSAADTQALYKQLLQALS